MAKTKMPMNTVILTLEQRMCMSKLTREGYRDMTNYKPYRNKEQKVYAKKTARVSENGNFYSKVDVCQHPINPSKDWVW